MRRLISSKTLWNLHIAQRRTEEISAWVAANGIDPDDVSVDHDLTVEDSPDGLVIRCRAYLRNANGARYRVDGEDDAASEERTVPLTVEPPDGWPVYALVDRKEQPLATTRSTARATTAACADARMIHWCSAGTTSPARPATGTFAASPSGAPQATTAPIPRAASPRPDPCRTTAVRAAAWV